MLIICYLVRKQEKWRWPRHKADTLVLSGEVDLLLVLLPPRGRHPEVLLAARVVVTHPRQVFLVIREVLPSVPILIS